MSTVRRVAVVGLLVLAVVALVVWLAHAGSVTGFPPCEGENATLNELRPRQRSRTPRRAAEPTDVGAGDTADASGRAERPVEVSGWPAADVFVRRADGTGVPGATVYVLPSGEPSPSEMVVGRKFTSSEGRVRIPVSAPRRYDVGAFVDSEFGTLVREVAFPARAPVEIVLPEVAPLEIRKEGDLPEQGWVTVARADSSRIRGFPGRGESRSVGGQARKIGSSLSVPRGVLLRVRATGGVVATPSTVVAPGPVTIRPDGRSDVPVEFVFVSAADLASRRFAFEFEFESSPGDPESVRREYAVVGPSGVGGLNLTLRCAQVSTTVEWTVVRGRKGSATIDTSSILEGARRIEVPISLADFDLGSRACGLRVLSPETTATTLLSIDSYRHLFGGTRGGGVVRPGEEYWFEAATSQPVAAVSIDSTPPLVAGPVVPRPDMVTDLTLDEGAYLRIRWERPAAVGLGSPLRVRRADSDAFLNGELSPLVVKEAVLVGPTAMIGPFSSGDVELAFLVGDREIGRRSIGVVPGPPIDVHAPDILPPVR